jgi:simple sugar transport system permease protein
MDEARKSGFKIKALTNYISLPTLIIGAFWVLILMMGVANELLLSDMLSDGIKRFGRWGILTLAMVPAIQSGVGPNFALPIGIVCGLLAQVCAIAWGFTGLGWVVFSCLLAIVIASIVGYGYGKLMNAVKGSEMSIATYTGFSATMLFSLVWLVLPFRDQRMTWPLGRGTGLRQTIQLDVINASQILDNFLSFKIRGVIIPTGMLLVLFAVCFLVWLFMRSKTGIAISAGGSNPMFANAAGLNVDRGRIIANVISTVLGALGILVYAQSYGYTQLYDNPLMMAFPAVAGVLIGGASVSRAKITHVIVGAFILQGMMATSLPVANELFAGTDLSETLRMIIQNGIILYALMQAGAKRK